LGNWAFPVLYNELSSVLPVKLIKSARAGFCYREKKLLFEGKLHEVCPEDIREIIFANVDQHFQCAIDELPFDVTPAYCTLDLSRFSTQQQERMFQSLEEVLERFKMPYVGSPKYIVYKHQQALAIEVDFVTFVQDLFNEQATEFSDVAVVEFSTEEFCITDDFIRLPVEDMGWVIDYFINLETEYSSVVDNLIYAVE
jgi:hypothetical protein